MTSQTSVVQLGATRCRPGFFSCKQSPVWITLVDENLLATFVDPPFSLVVSGLVDAVHDSFVSVCSDIA